ncbi:MAG: 16S rRNA (cytidine(1402)-2'-O)-methyltransferase [Victivallaceae bacterium]|nr:16S rRNA (cytidine(1402)-2'-O)-methyltransferase [Victivallaceae bacterium]
MEDSGKGRLYLVTTPIGNLDDMTFRAVATLKEADLVAAEDTRRTKILLDHFGIHVKLASYHAFNEHGKSAGLLDEVRRGATVAMVSDAGTPAIADPGFFLVREAVRAGIEPIVIPGVSAVTFSATAAALPVHEFSFLGFVPVKSGRKRAFFEEIARSPRTCFVFESPYRVAATLAMIAEVIGPDASVAVIREATKIHEQVIRGSAAEVAAAFEKVTPKGEFVIGIHPSEGAAEEEEPQS